MHKQPPKESAAICTSVSVHQKGPLPSSEGVNWESCLLLHWQAVRVPEETGVKCLTLLCTNSSHAINVE